MAEIEIHPLKSIAIGSPTIKDWDLFLELVSPMKPRMTLTPERKSLSDITNSASSKDEGEDLTKKNLLASGKDYASQLVKESSALLKLMEETKAMELNKTELQKLRVALQKTNQENSALLRLREEKSKAMELNNTELQKLRVALQKTNQENWLLAQSNSQMLAELNKYKDRLKSLQHELGCTTALLKAKTSEIEELRKLKLKELPKKDVAEPMSLASQKRVCNPNRKRIMRSQSLAPSISTQHAAPDEKDDNRRILQRRRSNLKRELSEASKDLLERKTNLVSKTVKESIGHPVKTELQEERKDEKIELRRSSLGRPLRKAVEKVSCYKEIPLNCKMRRD